jgi:hypothetical protein
MLDECLEEMPVVIGKRKRVLVLLQSELQVQLVVRDHSLEEPFVSPVIRDVTETAVVQFPCINFPLWLLLLNQSLELQQELFGRIRSVLLLVEAGWPSEVAAGPDRFKCFLTTKFRGFH